MENKQYAMKKNFIGKHLGVTVYAHFGIIGPYQCTVAEKRS